MDGATPDWWPARAAFLAAPVPADGLARLAGDVVPGGSVTLRGRAGGGMEAAVALVDLVDRAGHVTPAILKRRDGPAVDGSAEWAALHAARPASVPTPEPIAIDRDGRWFGLPALVMSRVGGVGRPSVDDDAVQIGDLARALAAVHDCDGEPLEAAVPRWRREPPADATPYEAAVWARIAELAPSAGPAAALTHGDFHPGNALWHGARLSGVVDWENGARGWPEEDVAKCRWYLHLAHGPAAADRFWQAYASETGATDSLLPLCEASYALGTLRRTAQRAFFLRWSGLDGDADAVRRTSESIIERTVGVAPPRL